MKNITLCVSHASLAIGISAIAIATPSYAQTTDTAAPVSDAAIEDIVVTAQKRTERLQDVPISIGAISASQAGAKGINDTASLQAAVPGLVINRTANEGNIFLRGVGTNLFGPSSEQTVAVYVDNVYYASPAANLFTFNNIERIEVLKGPQGTLFGRNTTGGVVHVITRDPADYVTGQASFGIGNYETVEASAYVSTPITETLAADVAVRYGNQGEGWGRNINTGLDNAVMEDGNFAVRSKVKWEPSSSTVARLAVDYAHSRARFSYQLAPGVSGIDGVSTYPGEYNATSGLRDMERVNTGGASLQIEQAIGDLQLVSITAYRESDVAYLLDQDDTPDVAADLSLPSEVRSWSQELQLQSASSSPIQWVVGGFFFDTKAGYTPADINNGAVVITDEQHSQSWAGFGQATIEIFPDTNLTGGLRYTYERQKLLVDSFTVGGASVPVSNDRQSFRKLTWRAAVDHRFTPDILAYASYNRGFKSGGYNLLQPADDPFKPEVLDAYEVGLKTEWFDRSVRLNLAAFLYEYKNIQVTIPQLGSIVTRNAAEARVKGVEATLQVRPFSDLNLDANVSYLDGEYKDYPNAAFVAADGSSTTQSATGNRTIATPKFTASFGGDYTVRTGAGDLIFAANAAYNDGFFFYADNRLEQPDYWVLNGSLTFAFPDEKLDLRLWAKNLTDATYYSGRSEQAGLGDAQRQAAPRTYGATVTTRF